MPLDEFHAYMGGKHAKQPEPKETPMLGDTSLLRLALIGLIAGFLLCLGGIIWLAAAEPARSIPDILVGTTTLIVGGILGILVPSKRGE